jgi:hypothetical protein
MNGDQLREIRHRVCGPSVADKIEFGRMLGLSGDDTSIDSSMRRLETMRGHDITKTLSLLARFFDWCRTTGKWPPDLWRKEDGF